MLHSLRKPSYSARKFGPRSCANSDPALTNNCIRGAIMAACQLPSPDELRQLFRYDADTGRLYWAERPLHLCHDLAAQRKFNSRVAGKEAGAVDRDGYLLVGIYGKTHKLHRVVFALNYGRWPIGVIDHINHDKRDNRTENLREVSAAENCKNLPARSANTGVYWTPRLGKWRAQIHVAGKAKHLGCFSKLSDALAARDVAYVEAGYHPNHSTWTGVDVETLRREVV